MRRCIRCRKRASKKGSPYCRMCMHLERLLKCRVCGGAIEDPNRHVYCSAECSKLYFSQLRQDCMEARMCPRCQQPAEKGKRHCRKCLDHMRGINRARKERANKTACSRCLGPNHKWRKFKTCDECRRYMKGFRDTMKQRTGTSWSDYCRRRMHNG